MSRCYYVHTINGRPGGFDGMQICYAGGGRGWHAPAVRSLRQIRREQQASIRFRRATFQERAIEQKYGYVIIRTPDA